MSNSGAATGGNASGPAGGELAGNYPNPTLAPAAVLSRLESQFTGNLQLVMGTAAGAGALVTMANGYGVTGFAANPPTPAVALSTVTSFITSDVVLTGLTAAAITSVSLAAGTWMLFPQVFFASSSATAQHVDLWVSTTSAGGVALIVGVSGTNAADGSGWRTVACHGVTTLGATSTVFVNVECTQGGSIDHNGGIPTAAVYSGITAVRIA